MLSSSDAPIKPPYVRIAYSVSEGKGTGNSPLTPNTTAIDEETIGGSSSPSPSNGGEITQAVSSTNRKKISDRLKKLGKDIRKIRKNNDKSTLDSPRVTVDSISLPPTPETFVSGLSSPLQDFGNTKLLDIVSQLEEETSSDKALPDTSNEATETTSFTQRLQAFIYSLSIPTSSQTRPVEPDQLVNPNTPIQDVDSASPKSPRPVDDSRLIRFLSSPTAMNGSTLKCKPSIWSILDNIPNTGQSSAGNISPEERNVMDEEQSMLSDTSSVMVYSPLIPLADDHVELAEHVSIESQEENAATVEKPDLITGTSWTSMWPLSWWHGSASAPPDRNVSTTAQSPPSSAELDGRSRRQAWVPSSTRLSVQAMWWGYRMYLPPPVLEILDDQTLEATKRAAIITTALTWFFNNLPVDVLPPTLRPIALLLQHLAPYLSYIGTFISWSWSTIKSYDVGHGVTLTATWLLPVALIPGTWNEYDFPRSPSQHNPIPLPSYVSSFYTPSVSLSSLPTSPPLSSIDPSTSESTPRQSSVTPFYTPSSGLTNTNLLSPNSYYVPLTTTSTTFTPMYAPSPPSARSPRPATTPLPLSPRILYRNPNSASPIPTVYIPVAPAPMVMPPIPPIPSTPAVPVGSPLSEQLLHGPKLDTIPLPEDDNISQVDIISSSPKMKTGRIDVVKKFFHTT